MGYSSTPGSVHVCAVNVRDRVLHQAHREGQHESRAGGHRHVCAWPQRRWWSSSTASFPGGVDSVHVARSARSASWCKSHLVAHAPTLHGYVQAFTDQQPLLKYLGNSLMVAALATVCSLVVASSAAYAIG